MSVCMFSVVNKARPSWTLLFCYKTLMIPVRKLLQLFLLDNTTPDFKVNFKKGNNNNTTKKKKKDRRKEEKSPHT